MAYNNSWKVGDRVRAVRDYEGRSIAGLVGKVITINGSGSSVCVEFDNDMGGHTGSVKGKAGHCWNVNVDCLETESGEKKIVQYILQYMRDEDPFELFFNLEDAKVRIAKLTEERDVRRDSFVLYHVDQVQKVNIRTTVELVEEQAEPKRRGRPRKVEQQ